MSSVPYTEPEKLSTRLDTALPPGSDFVPRETTDVLVNTAAAVARMQLPEITADALVRIEARMFAALDAALAPPPALAVVRPSKATPTRRYARMLMRYAAAAVALVILFSTVITPAVANSLPNEALYPVKRVVEQFELALTSDVNSRTAVLVSHANRRAQEAFSLIAGGVFDEGLVRAAVDSSNEASSQAIMSSMDLRAQTAQTAYLLNYVLDQVETETLAPPATLDQLRSETASLHQLGQGVMIPIDSAVVTAVPPTVDIPSVLATDEPLPPSNTPAPTMTSTQRPSVPTRQPAQPHGQPTVIPTPQGNGQPPPCQGASCQEQGNSSNNGGNNGNGQPPNNGAGNNGDHGGNNGSNGSPPNNPGQPSGGGGNGGGSNGGGRP